MWFAEFFLPLNTQIKLYKSKSDEQLLFEMWTFLQTSPDGDSHQSQSFLEDGRESVFLHHKDVGRFALHCEPVGLTVEAHGTHKVLELGQQVS